MATKRAEEYLTNPLLLSVDAGLEVGEKLRRPLRGESKAEARQARKKVEKAIRPAVKKYGNDILEAAMSLAETSGGGLYAGRGLYAGGALYAQKEVKGRGKSKRLVDQKASLSDIGQFFSKELPRSFKGGSLQRNTQHPQASDLMVGGNLLSDYEIHPAVRSQSLHENFALSRTLPPQFQKYHTTIV
jgi:hypothetical protein